MVLKRLPLTTGMTRRTLRKEVVSVQTPGEVMDMDVDKR